MNFSLLLICLLLISTSTLTLGCGYCGKPTHKPTKPIHHSPIIPKVPLPPVTVPPAVPLPPVLPVPPVVPIPPVVPVLPPVVTLPPVIGGGGGSQPCPPGGPITKQPTCPINTLKLGACVDLLGGLIHIGLGHAVQNQCCPVLHGLVETEAAVCLCTTLKLKLLNLNLYVPLALQLLLTCGKTPPPGFTCSL